MPETSPDVVVGFRLHPTRQRDRGDVTTKRDGELAYPYAFASNDDAFGNIGGGVLWLISSPRYGAYRLPPSLVARLHIDRVVSRDQPMAQKIDSVVRNAGLHIAIADRDRSVYLPMNNAYHVLKRMRFDGKVTQLRCAARRAGPLLGRGPYTHLPSHFQRHRVLAPGGVATLEDYAEAVSKGRRVFLSYRWSDFTDDQDWLEELTNTLVANRASCWWDRWDVPQDDPQPIERLLGDILDDAVRQSAFLVALMRPRYLENGPCPVIPTWVRREWDQAGHENEQNRRHRMTRVAVLFGDQPAARQWLRPGDIPCRVAPDEPAHNVADLLTSLLPS